MVSRIKNEGYEIVITDSNGNFIATASQDFTNIGTLRNISVFWDTEGISTGRYFVNVTKRFYSFYQWNEAPTKSILLVDVVSYCEKNGHIIVSDPSVPVTCTEAGLTEGRHCEYCNEVFVEQEVIPATGHHDDNNDDYCDYCNLKIDKTLNCSCRCHKTDFFSRIIWFFQKLFGAKRRPCECGASHR